MHLSSNFKIIDFSWTGVLVTSYPSSPTPIQRFFPGSSTWTLNESHPIDARQGNPYVVLFTYLSVQLAFSESSVYETLFPFFWSSNHLWFLSLMISLILALISDILSLFSLIQASLTYLVFTRVWSSSSTFWHSSTFVSFFFFASSNYYAFTELSIKVNLPLRTIDSFLNVHL